MVNDYGEYLDYKTNKQYKDKDRGYYEALKASHEILVDTSNVSTFNQTYDSYGDYLDYKIINSESNEERDYYRHLKDTQVSDNSWHPSIARPYVNQPVDELSNDNISYESIEPLTVETDKELQDALNNNPSSGTGTERDLNLNARTWGGMESGAINFQSTQSPNWIATVPDAYRYKASQWADNQGICEIIPLYQKQKFTYTTVTYISKNTQEPKTQRFPISDVSGTPHQIKFDMYDTTEGRMGVSNAVEVHQAIEFDVYLTDYVFYYWNFGNDNENKYYVDVLDKAKNKFWNAVHDKTYTDSNLIRELEQTTDFVTFRNSFLQQHSGWFCEFNSHAFGTFCGVINDVSYQINSGETFAKWHIKLEEAIFTKDTSTSGKKEEQETSGGSDTDSGTATDIEETPT